MMTPYIFQNFHHNIRHLLKRKITIKLDSEALNTLTLLANEEQRSVQYIAAELLHHALSQRQEAEAYLQRWQGLSPREKQVTALICLNYTNAEIAQRLIISPETVKSHIRNILAKMAMHSKADLRQALADWDFQEWLAKSS